ncbi:GNAT family N-acetyltransferase [Sphingomonas canadensis]|uniref:GNAT family N-acetyltransferase n=1 Tax=Sphingomonas canadensis TaxID=1219257 RepID=A0ABW3HE47_9SPHN|nr:GNAT family N-acetyltransferase [Sphingomonas canadensis]MCW3837158.1 GNAT family N-acetyltransferase [Sphingomonas canadensis]
MIAYSDGVPADGPELDAMAQESWIATFAHSCSEADRNAYFATAYGPDGALIRDLADPAHAYRIARVDGRIAGYAKLSPAWLPDAEEGAVQLSQLYVLGAFHGTGIARTLMDWTIAAARARGARALLLTVWEHNPRAIRFYQRKGFVHIGDYAFQVGEQTDRDLILRLAL